MNFASVGVIGTAIAFSGALVVASATSGISSKSQEVDGPAVGPSGQTGQMTYLENPAVVEFDGSGELHGPYRLLPPGTKYVSREYSRAWDSADYVEASSSDVLDLISWAQPPLEHSLASARGTLVDGEIATFDIVWRRDGGSTVTLSGGRLAPWRLPLDVYLHPADSAIQVRPIEVHGYPAIIVEPSSGPAPNVGYLRIAFDGFDLAIQSPDLPHDQLVEVADNLIGGAE